MSWREKNRRISCWLVDFDSFMTLQEAVTHHLALLVLQDVTGGAVASPSFASKPSFGLGKTQYKGPLNEVVCGAMMHVYERAGKPDMVCLSLGFVWRIPLRVSTSWALGLSWGLGFLARLDCSASAIDCNYLLSPAFRQGLFCHGRRASSENKLGVGASDWWRCWSSVALGAKQTSAQHYSLTYWKDKLLDQLQASCTPGFWKVDLW